MKITNFIKSPILSEKAYRQMEKGVYTFLVSPSANKANIAKSIAKHFSVKVEKVNITKIQAKEKRIARTRKTTLVGGGKKATVWLAKGNVISSLMPKSQNKKQTKKGGEKEVETTIEGESRA